ncbi:MAG: hypothetical protein DRR08_24380 [Candidatus Parabeggiatoa sp. nov. 2]|nr:MAG: hypothetical protein B6247_11710 [Beggiatoa sp. 4572_84]RKZ55430.1 MAG: hypothetical protein DRR08_24380 [Gammaproteobacteria bacterium]
MTTNTYDEIPYPSLVYADTHPGRLATLATLFGLKPPSVAKCRVLELGCGDGTNLIAIAQSLPQASLWGIDYSAKQIATGQAVIEAIHLPNITLKQLDLNEVDESLGKFDYIIAHGVYSWIPQEMQETVLSLIQQHLAANGIAYISYNIYPGWHTENIVRDMMMYHTQQLPDAPFHLSMMHAKGILQFLANIRKQGNGAFDLLLQEKWQQLQAVPDNYLYHDLLEEENHPVYFHQFIKQATQHRLAYVTDIEFRHYLMLSFPQQVVETFEEFFQGDFFKQEQYMDFFLNRTLRRSLLCHQDMSISRELDWKRLPECYIAAPPSLQPVGKEDSEDSAQFKKADGEIITIKHPLIKTAIRYLLSFYPHRISFEALFKYACQQLPQSASDSALRETFAKKLLRLYCLEAIELNIEPPPFVTTLGTYPTASPLARFLAARGQQSLINLRCEFTNLSAIATVLLPHLNGQNNSQELGTILTKMVKKQKIDKKLNAQLEKALLEIAQAALLVQS